MAVNSRPVHSLKNDLSITYSRSHLNESFIKDLTKLVYPKPVHFIPAGGAVGTLDICNDLSSS
ncbi:unnamed protein product [Schistosoma curassoni]|uniref:FAD-binding PCMH-type domain-containing protein n=1 Tax=Schistosoma curassoni TaxID=6186 RepID=A0A183L319_9TREM|nr:unnamed protein product [Schistosoma curassoni]